MMYKKNYILAVKTGGKILREQNDRVQLPFGYEYSILLKNLDSVRAVAELSIDGVRVDSFIVPPNGQIEVERFLKGNLNNGNKFKFIERTRAVESGRGIKAEDGLIRCEFKREIVQSMQQIVWHQHYEWPVTFSPRPYDRYYGGLTRSCFNTAGGISGQSVHVNNVQSASGTFNMSESSVKTSTNDVGITAPGSLSDQKFVVGEYFPTESTSQVLVLHLVGTHSKSQPKTVDVKPVCQTCKKHNKATSQFCSRCGTSLRLV